MSQLLESAHNMSHFLYGRVQSAAESRTKVSQWESPKDIACLFASIGCWVHNIRHGAKYVQPRASSLALARIRKNFDNATFSLSAVPSIPGLDVFIDARARERETRSHSCAIHIASLPSSLLSRSPKYFTLISVPNSSELLPNFL